MFSTEDLKQIQHRGSDATTVQQQMENFKKGFPYLDIIKPATIGDGIQQLNKTDLSDYQNLYENTLKTSQMLKFVPASGAASRMFKDLYSFVEEFKGTPQDLQKFETENNPNSAAYALKNIKKFAFYEDLNEAIKKSLNKDIDAAMAAHQYIEIINCLLTSSGLNYGNLPKGLLKFHQYDKNSRTPLEEHLVEGANYCNDSDNIVQIHLTVSTEHKSGFIQKFEEIKSKYEKEFNVKFQLSYSEQKPSTDTIAADGSNLPFREKDGTLLFRPGGHGALIENLNDINADYIFIKNIDNVVPDHLKPETYNYKKALAGVLKNFETKTFNYLRILENEEITNEKIDTIQSFLEKDLCVIVPNAFEKMNLTEKTKLLKEKLDRPIRVCGMVLNAGEPGGGPFWAKNTDGSMTLQIAESSQIDMKNPEKATIAKNATHFNPVDLVCGVKDYKGKKFDLLKFTDPQTGFISSKSKDGKELKAQELPGLWNGAMSNWNTLFVEVPMITFNPVKTVNDLLRKEHQS